LGITGGRAQGTPTVFINEIHYDNAGTDTGEFVEIAGPAGTSLTGYQILLYNGAGGAVYDTKNLTGTIPDQVNGFGTVAVATVGIQMALLTALRLSGTARYCGSSRMKVRLSQLAVRPMAWPAKTLV
jgi:hypothetical protein